MAEPIVPAVSVVIPTRNRERLIGRAVANALAQVDVAHEVVVVDDASTDGTLDRLTELSDPRLRVVGRAEQGRLARARNSGIQAAAGEWIALLDDDDVWAPDKLARQLAAAIDAGAGFSYSGALTVDDDLRPLHRWRLPDPEELLAELLALNVMPAGASNVLVRADLMRDLGGFDTELSHTADWDMWIRMAAATGGAAVTEIQVAYRIHPHGQESNRGVEMMEELQLIENKHRELRSRLGVELDRKAFADYARKRGGAPNQAAASRSRLRRVLPEPVVTLARRMRPASAPRGGIASPEWLTRAAAAQARLSAG